MILLLIYPLLTNSDRLIQDMNSRLKDEHDTSKTKFVDLISGEHMNQQQQQQQQHQQQKILQTLNAI